jgi:hypothetical protein
VAGKLLGLIRLRLGRTLRAQMESRDILQATLLKSFEHLPQFEQSDSASLMAWLARIAETPRPRRPGLPPWAADLPASRRNAQPGGASGHDAGGARYRLAPPRSDAGKACRTRCHIASSRTRASACGAR